jgi:hypothetical protein
LKEFTTWLEESKLLGFAETWIGVLTVAMLSYVVKIYLYLVAFCDWLGKFLNEGIIFSEIFTCEVVFYISSRMGCFFFPSLIFLIKLLIFSGGSI